MTGTTTRTWRRTSARTWLSAAGALCLTPLLAGPALASAPLREYVDFADRSFTGVCSFTVSRHITSQNSLMTTFSDGDQLLTGTFKQTLTNDSTGLSMDVVASGPVLIDNHPDGSSTETSMGPQFLRPPGQLLLTTGQVIVERDASGAIVGFDPVGGTVRDVCDLLG